MTFNPLDRNGFIFAVGMLWQKITEKIDSLPVNGNPVGTVISFMGNNAPINYLKCDGTVYNISAYSVLANFFKSEFGSFNYFGGNGTTTFAVPDLRGEFLRGTGTAKRNTGSGASVGAHQDGTHICNVGAHVNADGATGWIGAYADKSGLPVDNIGDYNVDSIGGSSVALTLGTTAYNTDNYKNKPTWIAARPTNTSVLYCIKYK